MNAPAEAVFGPWVWRGADLTNADDWILELDRAANDELAAAADGAADIPLDLLSPENFSLPRISVKLAETDRQLREGRGFVLIRGLDIAGRTDAEMATLYCGIGAHLGVSVSQSAAGDRLGEVTDRGGTDRYYTRGGALEFHMDPVDVVGLLCLRTARSGGASRIASAFAIHNAILDERPDLHDVLVRGFHNSRRGHGETTRGDRVPMFAGGPGGPECYHLPITIRQAAAEGFALDEREQEAMAFVDEVASRPGLYLDMDFRPGDIQFLNNRRILHARTDYRDHPEPDRKRLLLRLWLMMPQWPPRADCQNFNGAGDRAGGGVRVPSLQPA